MPNKPLVILDEKANMKYGDSIQSKFPKSDVAVVRDGTAKTASTWGDPFPKTLVYSKEGNFYGVEKPGLFSRGKVFPVRIYHFSREMAPIKLDYVNAAERGSNKILFCVCFKDLEVEATFRAGEPAKYEKTFKDLKIALTPGSTLFTEENMKGLFKAFAEATLGDMINMVDRSALSKPNPTTIDQSKKTPGNMTYPTKFRLEFVKRMILRFRDIGISLSFIGDGYAYGRAEDLQ